MNLSPKIFLLLFLFAFLSLISSPRSSAQAKDQLRQQAEEQLKKMTPEEIDAKLKELGMTRWEAIRRAQDLGITLEDFVGRAGQVEEEGTVSAESDTLQRVAPKKAALRPQIRPKLLLVIPGFTGRTGIDSTIRPFGYDLFEFPQATFEPPLNLSTPTGYVLGPGDQLTVSVWGETRLNLLTTVNRDGNVVIQDVGPVSANGQTIQQFRERLLRRMTGVYSGLRNGASDANAFLDVSLGKLRSIQIYVVGEVKRPGGYVVSSMSTTLQALYLAGGPTVNGTLRHVAISRSGGVKISEVDLYQYLLKGDRSKDIRLDDGDVVYIGPAQRRVAVLGWVVRPGIYEAVDKEGIADVAKLAGGPLFDTDLRRVHIERVIPFTERQNHQKDLLDIDLTFDSLKEYENDNHELADGDVVSLFRISRLHENLVSISGSVNKPGPFELKKGMRIRDLIMEADSLRRGAFTERGLLLRLLPNLRREALPFSPRLAIEGNESANVELQNEDSLVIFNEQEFRPVGKVAITGAVRKPDYYPRYEDMTLHDLVVLAGGLQEGAEFTGWEISRLDTTSLGVYAKIIKITSPFKYKPDADDTTLYLKDFDYVFVPFDPKFQVQKFVDLQGYVMYPGPYPIRFEGEKLADVIKRAGGLRPGAYLEGSRIFRRGQVKDRIIVGQIPIDFGNALKDANSRDNLVLYEKDSIYISYLEDVVRVSGEVFVPSAVLYKKGEDLDYYLDQAGGLKDEADGGRVYVLLPGGKKWEGGGFLGLGGGEILPGSSIYVPKKIEKEDKTLPVIRDFATILVSLAAITVAIVQVTKK